MFMTLLPHMFFYCRTCLAIVIQVITIQAVVCLLSETKIVQKLVKPIQVVSIFVSSSCNF